MIEVQFATLAVSGLLGIGYLRYVSDTPGTLRTVCKILPILLLAFYAATAGGPALLVLALLLSALGDAFLAYEGDVPLLGGLSSFLLAHVAYIALFLSTADPGLLTLEPWRWLAAVAVIALGLGMALRLRRPVGNLVLPVMAYITVIVAMAVTALMLEDATIFVGAIIFMLSDTALALRIFVFSPDSRIASMAAIFVWASYYTAQLVLTLALIGF